MTPDLEEALSQIRAILSGRSDPSALTTQQILREIENLRVQIETRLSAMDKAVALFKDDITRVPTELDKRLLQVSELFESKLDAIGGQFRERDIRVSALAEANRAGVALALDAAKEGNAEQNRVNSLRFDGIQVQFAERDTRVGQEAKASSTAVAAALQAQKEAAGETFKSLTESINKSEKATQTQLEQQRLTVASNAQNLSDKIAELNSRITRAEGAGMGRTQVTAPLVAIIVAVVGGLVLSAAIALRPAPTQNTADVSAAARIAVLEQAQREHEIEDQRRAAGTKP